MDARQANVDLTLREGGADRAGSGIASASATRGDASKRAFRPFEGVRPAWTGKGPGHAHKGGKQWPEIRASSI